jgi:hypothetical protein
MENGEIKKAVPGKGRLGALVSAKKEGALIWGHINVLSATRRFYPANSNRTLNTKHGLCQ